VDETSRRFLNAFVSDLRDIADTDYIAARACHRMMLLPPAAWSAAQAVEKYLKAILLFQCRSVKRFRNHELMPLVEAVKALPSLNFKLPDGADKFITRVSDEGSNRYGDFQRTIDTLDVFELDRLVWHVRRYCQDFLLMPGDEQRYPGESQKRLAAVPSAVRSSATASTFRIDHGYLENVLAGGGFPLRIQRDALVWKNRFYGTRTKGRIRFVRRVGFKKPIHIMRPQILWPILEPLVHVPSDLREWLKQQYSTPQPSNE
jgi:HEPN domain-containing protein